jgi:hypothetical protein
MSYWRWPLGVVFVALGSSCSSVDSGSDGAAASSYGASSSAGGSGSGYMPPTCDQGCQDYLVSYGLDDTIWFIWNQRLAGHPSGAQDVMGACPLGGTVHITGSDTVAADGTTSTEMQFELTACENSDTQYDLTFTGSVSMEGSFNAATDFAAEVFSAPGLQVTGGLNWYDDPAIDQSCDVTVSQQGGGDAFTIGGRVCGRDFNEDSLKHTTGSNTGQGGGSGNGSAGTSSNNCACFCPNGSSCTAAKTPNPCGVDADGIPEPCGCPVDCK